MNRQQFVGPFAHCHNFTYKQNGSSSPYYCNNRGTFKWQIYYDDSQANHHTHCEWSAVTATDLVGKLLSFANIYIEREKEREPSALSQNWSETIIIINWIKCNEYNEWIVCQPLLDGHIVLLFT